MTAAGSTDIKPLDECKYDVSNVIRLKTKLCGILDKYRIRTGTESYPLSRMIGDPLNDVVPVLARAVSDTLHADSSIIERSLYAILDGVEGGYPLRRDYNRALWVLAARAHDLRSGVVNAVVRPAYPEWVPAVCVDFIKTRDRRGTAGAALTFRSIAGELATNTTMKFFTHKARGFLKASFGLGIRAKVGPLSTFVGMRTWLYVDPVLSRDWQPIDFDRMECPEAWGSANRKLMNERKQACINGFHNVSCYDCGYGLEHCYRATHALSYRLGICKTCNNTEAIFNESDGPIVELCIDCRERERMRKRKGR